MFEQCLNDDNKGYAHLPLKVGSVPTDDHNSKITVEEIKIVGRAELINGEASAVMFSVLRALRRKLVNVTVTAFDGHTN